MKDITTKKDIELLITAFYKKAFSNPIIGPFFTEIAAVNLEDHIPEITDFWEQQLLRTGTYKKNVIKIHKDLQVKKQLEKIHFHTWLNLFNETVDTHFKGEKAELIKTRALSIATILQIKLNTSSS
ncbi:group III truncated hemoglobin [Aquimarina sp. 2201CG1-2-11]|uniref:group III truncated hemoglobin n=1 Tax=Aquimarina discodermiae TaxID=3231043 RepID=UPI003461CED1